MMAEMLQVADVVAREKNMELLVDMMAILANDQDEPLWFSQPPPYSSARYLSCPAKSERVF